MGIVFQSDKFEITDAARQLKFSTARKMPHLLYSTTGTYTVPAVRNGQNYVERVDEKIVLTNSNINTNDPFTMGFYEITGGVGDTNGKIAVGGGSIILRLLRRDRTGEFLGSSILDIKVESGVLKLTVSQNLDRRQYGGGTYGSPLIADIREQDVLGDEAVSISYRIFYGRFQ